MRKFAVLVVGILLLVCSMTPAAAARPATEDESPGLRPSHHRSGRQDCAGQQSRPEDRLPQPRQLQRQGAGGQDQALPAFNIYTFASQLLSPISFEVPAGQFGSYPGIGPIPATNTNITTPSQPTAYIFATVSQPLLTLYKINLHVHGEQLSVEQAVQQLREQRNTVVNDVRQAYYSDGRDSERDRRHAGEHQAI